MVGRGSYDSARPRQGARLDETGRAALAWCATKIDATTGIRALALTAALVLTGATSVQAQIRTTSFPDADPPPDTAQSAVTTPPAPPFRPLRVAKWSAFTASVAAAGYGFARQQAANRELEKLERICADDVARCQRLPGSSEYADPTLAAMHGTVNRNDRHARYALIASQVGVVATVALFLLDLREQDRPPNQPYEPPVRVGANARGAVEVGVRLSAGSP